MYLIDPVHLETFLKPNNTNKKSRGEVFTPPNLVNEMLDKMEEYNPGCFSNPNLKWMDNSCGIGNFLVLVFHRLMSGLSNVFPDPDIRKQHILKNMIYGVDICPLNISICKLIFGINGEENNLVCGDGLVDHFNLKMDCIVGNPPYQKESINGKAVGGRGFWCDFIHFNLSVLKQNGFLSLIHPNGWRKPEAIDRKSTTHNMYNIMTKERTMLYLSIHNTKEGIKTFGCGTRYDWYILKNTKNQGIETVIKTEIETIEKINLLELDFIPNYNITTLKKMLGRYYKVYCSKDSVHTHSKLCSSKQSEEFKYPLIHATTKTGTRYMYSNVNNKGHFGVSKIIFGESGINQVILDYEGKYGLTDNAIGIKICSIKEGQLIKQCLESDKFKTFLKSCSWSNFRVDWRLFTHLDKDFYKHFIE